MEGTLNPHSSHRLVSPSNRNESWSSSIIVEGLFSLLAERSFIDSVQCSGMRVEGQHGMFRQRQQVSEKECVSVPR